MLFHYSHLIVKNAPRHFRALQTKSLTRPPLGFAFDIDGVLLAGSQPIPGASRALQILNGDNQLNLKIPYILLTNGGGSTEEERARKLSSRLGVEISSSQIVQAHTVLKDFTQEYADKAVLCLGGIGNQMSKVAESYGFRRAYTTTDVLAWNSSVWPFMHVSGSDLASAKQIDFSRTPISAVFVFHDPRNWGVDVQIMCDIIQSGGVIGSPYVDSATRRDRKIQIIFCNPDLLWKSDFARPRLGQGAFRESFQAVFKAAELDRVNVSSRPAWKTDSSNDVGFDLFLLLNQSLIQWTRRWMIGDNPESDIAGANAAGWSSVLVPGVYDPTVGVRPTHEPTHIAQNVEEAVLWAIEREIS
ncbi:hypothetical protein D9757_005645 [Collybiopsis confluens]|uniref:Uncharacterized protein n=1 Tax=Collybiopsis confluens TaxID=2823264 RepID=A0A8H5HSU8_9AGAR|nr:hypothetical protein D9757_005645 [Collybiopsis confluens]